MGITETTDDTTEKSEELGARPKEFTVDFNKDIDLELLDTKTYNTPQEVFDFFHSKSENPDEIMTRKEVDKVIERVSRI